MAEINALLLFSALRSETSYVKTLNNLSYSICIEIVYKLLKEVATAMRLHAEQTYPNECCGLIGGNGKLLTAYYPLTNSAEQPRRSFFATPEDLFKAVKKMRTFKQEHLGIYHSHPSSEPYPSKTDVEMAFYPEAINFILSLHPEPKLCAYHIEKGQISKVDFCIVDLEDQ